MKAPQVIVLFFLVMSVVMNICEHGKEKSLKNFNGPIALLDAALTFALLWWGGFFG